MNEPARRFSWFLASDMMCYGEEGGGKRAKEGEGEGEGVCVWVWVWGRGEMRRNGRCKVANASTHQAIPPKNARARDAQHILGRNIIRFFSFLFFSDEPRR